MKVDMSPRAGVATARALLGDLSDRLGLGLPREARPGADLWARVVDGLPWPRPAPLLAAADGWVHPGPPTAWATFTDMVIALGATPPAPGALLPDLGALSVEAVDAEAGAWMLPAVAVRSAPARPVEVPALASADHPGTASGATVVVLGTAWATPLVGVLLARLGARVVRVEHPGRPDPFPLHRRLLHGQDRVDLDLGRARDRDRFAALLGRADLLVDGHPPRVLANAGLGAAALTSAAPSLAIVRIAAFADDDRPGYGPAAEARGGWAARHDPPRLGRSSLADPVAGLVGAITAVHALAAGTRGARARVSLEGAVGLLLAAEERARG
jgi:CoA-transferase family III